MQEKYAQLALENTVRLLGIDSPAGYTENAAKYVQAQFAQMGYDAKITRKGGVLMYLAVIGYKKAKDSLHGIAAVLFAIVGFIVCGFEHSIADMGYLAIAIPNLSFWQILQCMGMILVIMLGNVFGGKLMRMVLVDWQEKDA